MKIMVVSTPKGPELPATTAELIGGARSLDAQVEVAVIGQAVAQACRDAASFGAGKVYRVENEAFSGLDADACLQAAESIARQSDPDVILLTADALGSEIGPRLAYRLSTGAVTSCSGMRLSQDGETLFARPVYGGKAVAEMAVTSKPAVAVVAARSFEPSARDDSLQAEVVDIDLGIDPASGRTRVIEVSQEEVTGVRLEDARVVVSGGRGLGEAANFEYVEKLARVMGAAVGSSRPPVDAGWVPSAMQVGQTGKAVTPDLYVAVGISGQSQHLAGMGRARHIVVINKDPEAPFFRFAELGVVADFKTFLPVLTEKLRSMRQE